MKILLVEPYSNCNYPPLGLMKLATYHKLKGDEVSYVKGKNSKYAKVFWDHIYITSVFTYDIKYVIRTAQYYSHNLFNFGNTSIGGIAATLLPNIIKNNTGIIPHLGLLDEPDKFIQRVSKENNYFSYLRYCTPSIDNLPPDYSIFPEDNNYKKILENAYILYSTKGCPRNCEFCAVNKLEPNFVSYIPIKPRIKYIANNFGEKPGLVLLDNNVAASKKYYRIIDEIKDCGFHRGAKFSYILNNRTIKRFRYVDFNQGVDLRLLTDKKMKKMSEICINPLRLAFDDISLKELYLEKTKLAIDNGIINLSNFILYNFNDFPDDLYFRLVINTQLKKEHPEIKIYSFPMRYSPVNSTRRTYISPNWSLRQLRAVQFILNATHGIVSHQANFFYRAFGNDVESYQRILLYPSHYILNRDFYEYHTDGIEKWNTDYSKLSNNQRLEFFNIIKNGKLNYIPNTGSKKMLNILEHYRNEHTDIIPKEQKNEFQN